MTAGCPIRLPDSVTKILCCIVVEAPEILQPSSVTKLVLILRDRETEVRSALNIQSDKMCVHLS